MVDLARRAGRAVALAGLLALAACQTDLYTGQTDRSVNEMIAVLANSGIEASRSPGDEPGRFTLSVPRGDFARAVTILSERGLPRRDYSGLGDVFTGDKIVSTPFEERARFMYALAQDITGSLTRIAGVVDASVHVNVPEEQPLSGARVPSSASVFIYRDPAFDIESRIPTIKTLVTNVVDGLEYENVEVAVFDASSPATSYHPAGRSLSVPILASYVVLGLLCFVLWRTVTAKRPSRRRGEVAPPRAARLPDAAE